MNRRGRPGQLRETVELLREADTPAPKQRHYVPQQHTKIAGGPSLSLTAALTKRASFLRINARRSGSLDVDAVLGEYRVQLGVFGNTKRAPPQWRDTA